GLPLENQIDLDQAGGGGTALAALVEVGLAARGCGLVGRTGDIEQRDQPAVSALANLDQLLVMLLTDNGSEERLLGDVVALAQTRAVAVGEARQENLIEAADKLVLKGRPVLFIFEIRVHSRKGTRHRY